MAWGRRDDGKLCGIHPLSQGKAKAYTVWHRFGVPAMVAVCEIRSHVSPVLSCVRTSIRIWLGEATLVHVRHHPVEEAGLVQALDPGHQGQPYPWLVMQGLTRSGPSFSEVGHRDWEIHVQENLRCTHGGTRTERWALRRDGLVSPFRVVICRHTPLGPTSIAKISYTFDILICPDILWHLSPWYVSNISIIFDAPCLFLYHLLSVLLHFVAFLCIFRN
jgi:hypothetical protein